MVAKVDAAAAAVPAFAEYANIVGEVEAQQDVAAIAFGVGEQVRQRHEAEPVAARWVDIERQRVTVFVERPEWGAKIDRDQISVRVETQSIALGIDEPALRETEIGLLSLADRNEVEPRRDAEFRNGRNTAITEDDVVERRIGIVGTAVKAAIVQARAVRLQQPFALVILTRNRDVRAAVHEILAGQGAETIVGGIAAAGNAVLSVEF